LLGLGFQSKTKLQIARGAQHLRGQPSALSCNSEIYAGVIQPEIAHGDPIDGIRKHWIDQKNPASCVVECEPQHGLQH
jgi:hypothetical protein